MSRERTHDFRTCRAIVRGIISEVAKTHLSHEVMLNLRQARLFSAPEWSRLAAVRQQELLGMLRGAEDAWHACGAIVWTHMYQGSVVISNESRYDVADIDTKQSAFRWRATLDKFS